MWNPIGTCLLDEYTDYSPVREHWPRRGSALLNLTEPSEPVASRDLSAKDELAVAELLRNRVLPFRSLTLLHVDHDPDGVVLSLMRLRRVDEEVRRIPQLTSNSRVRLGFAEGV